MNISDQPLELIMYARERTLTRPIDLPTPPDEGDWALEVEVTAGDD